MFTGIVETTAKVVKIAKSAPREMKSKNIPQKLSYKYARLLELLPSEIKDLEQKITDLEQIVGKKQIAIDYRRNLR